MAANGDRERPVGSGVKVAIWITVSLLYVPMFLPLETRLARRAAGAADPAAWLSQLGAAIMAFGIVIEAVSDRQKAQAKRQFPDRFCDSGLFAIVRYPNYFGELLAWTGTVIAGASLLGDWLPWPLSLLGYLSIFLIMKGSTRRLELKQAQRYCRDPAFQAYIKQVPILFPCVPFSEAGIAVFRHSDRAGYVVGRGRRCVKAMTATRTSAAAAKRARIRNTRA